MSAADIRAHVVNCSQCNAAAQKAGHTLSTRNKSKSPKTDYPSVIDVTVAGSFDLSELAPIVQHHAELVAFGNCSPAWEDHKAKLSELLKFKHNDKLVVILEKRPNRKNPLCLDPMIIIRRTFLRDVIKDLRGHTLGELGIELVTLADKRGLDTDLI